MVPVLRSVIRTLDRIITVGFVIVEAVVVTPFTRGERERFGIIIESQNIC